MADGGDNLRASRDVRNAAVLTGLFAAAFVCLPLAALILFAFGLRECGTDCGPPTELLDALFLGVAYAAVFGALAACAARWALPHLLNWVPPAFAAISLLFGAVILAVPAVWVAPRLYTYVEYLRTPRDQLPLGDPDRRPSDCSKRKLPKDVICAV